MVWGIPMKEFQCRLQKISAICRIFKGIASHQSSSQICSEISICVEQPLNMTLTK